MGIVRSGYRVRTPGWVFIVVCVLVFLASINTGDNLLYLLGSVSAAFLLVSATLTYATLFRIRIRRRAPETVHRGERFGVNVQIENAKRYLGAWYLQVNDSSRPGETLAFVPRVPARAEADFRVLQVLPKRGYHDLARLSICSSFPIGLFERHRVLKDKSTLLVLPRIRPLRRSVLEEIEHTGSVNRRWAREGEEFFGLREYQPGDDPRMVSWRVSARVGELIVREMDPGASRAVVIAFDPRVPELYDEEEFELAVDLVASLAHTFLQREHQVGLDLPEDSVGLGLGDNHLNELLRHLALIEPVFDEQARGNASAAEWEGAARVVVSANPERWGEPLSRGSRIPNPREAFDIHAQ